MEFDVKLTRLPELLQAFKDAPGKVKIQLRQGLREALTAIQERARREHRFRTRSGNLERSIQTQILTQWPPTGRVWLNPAISSTYHNTMDDGAGNKIDEAVRYTADISYGRFQHDGTKDHPVAPVRKKALRWVSPGGVHFFSKGHDVKGIKPDPFIYKAAEFERENINKIFNRRIDEAITAAFRAVARGL